MATDQDLYLVGRVIKRDVPSWRIDLDNPANELRTLEAS
jgi:hypothetical protein